MADGSAAGKRPIARRQRPSRSTPAVAAGTSVTAVPDSPRPDERSARNDRYTAVRSTLYEARLIRAWANVIHIGIPASRPRFFAKEPVRAGSPPAQQVQPVAEPRQGGALRCRRCDLPRPRRNHSPRPSGAGGHAAVLHGAVRQRLRASLGGTRCTRRPLRRPGARRRRARRRRARGRLHGRRLRVRQHRDPSAARRAARAVSSRAPSSIPPSGSPCVPSPRAAGTSSGRRSTRRACSISAPSPTSSCRATRWPA